ncbi:MAG: hypothetical protein Q9M76_00875 [Candidatus Dojkabacteria bacterium]|nr:hypothetical protein [Candidatus Dojkabacteria bacterium]
MEKKLNEKLLEAIAIMSNVMRDVVSKGYIWGGCVADVYSGDFVREHEDIEYLIEDLHKKLLLIIKTFNVYGWEIESLTNGDLKAKSGDVEILMSHAEFPEGKEYARWYYKPELGYIEFPYEWLNQETILFNGVPLNAVSPEFQYVLRKNPKSLNPIWKTRDKDSHDLARLKEIIIKRGVDLESLDSNIKLVKII